MASAQPKQPPKLGVVRGKGTHTSDSIPAKLSVDEVVLNAGAAQALQKMLGKQSIAQFNAEYAPQGAQTQFKGGVLHASKGVPIPEPAPVFQPVPEVRAARPMLDWVDTPKPPINERVNDVDINAQNQAQNAQVRAQLGANTPGMGTRMENSATNSAQQAAQMRSDLANPPTQPVVSQPPTLQDRLPVANANAAEQAQAMRSTMGEQTGALKGRMDAAQAAAREGSHALRNTTGLGFQGQNGELPNYTNPELARVSPNAAPQPTRTMLDPWADSQSLAGSDIAGKLKAGVSGLGKVAGTAGSVLAMADLASQPSERDHLLTMRAENGDKQAAQLLATGGLNPWSEAIKKPIREGLDTYVNQPIAKGVNRLGSDFMAGTREMGGAIGRGVYDLTHGNAENPAVTTQPPPLATKPAPEQAKPTVNTTTQANTPAQAGGTASLRTRSSTAAPDAWNQGGSGNVERQSKIIAPGLLPASTKGTYDPQSGQSFIVGANGQKQWLPPRDEFAPKGTPQQQIYLAGLSPAEREARGGYANMQQTSGNPDQEAASQHWLLGNQGRNSPVLDLTGGNVYKGPMQRTTPLRVTPWNNPMTDANMQDFTPDYIKAAGDIQQGKEANAIARDTLAEDKRQWDNPSANAKLGGDRQTANKYELNQDTGDLVPTNNQPGDDLYQQQSQRRSMIADADLADAVLKDDTGQYTSAHKQEVKSWLKSREGQRAMAARNAANKR